MRVSNRDAASHVQRMEFPAAHNAPPVDDEEMPSAEMPSPPSTPKGNVNTQQVRVGDAHIP